MGILPACLAFGGPCMRAAGMTPLTKEIRRGGWVRLCPDPTWMAPVS